MRDCVAIFICHCETPLRRCGNLNIFKDLRDCFGRCTPSQRHCDTVLKAGIQKALKILDSRLRGNDN